MIGFLARSIPRRILASLVAIYVTTYVATALVFYSGVRAAILDSNIQALQQLAELKFERLETVIETLGTNVTAWSQLEVMNDLVSGDIDKRITRTLEGLKKLYGLPGDLYAFDAHGKLLSSTRGPGSVAEPMTLPPAWRIGDSRLAMLDKNTDPVTGEPAITLIMPVPASYDPRSRIGTLVLTCPWTAIERLLIDNQTGTILLATGSAPRLLAAAPASLVRPADLAGDTEWRAAATERFIIGKSKPHPGLLSAWQVQTLLDSDLATAALGKVGGELILLGILLAIPIVGLGLWLSNRLTAPVVELTRVVREIADTDKLDARVPVSSEDELGTLARSFNRMTESLEQATRERERFVRDLEGLNLTLEAKVAERTAALEAAILAQNRLIGDISHEIKSPLARLDVALGLARRATGRVEPRHFDRIEREVANISGLASEVLTLARLDGASAAVTFDRVDLPSIIRQIVADAAFETPGRATDLILDLPKTAVIIDGNADLLRRAIENVIRNAIFYTADSIAIDIVLRQSDETVTLEICDAGPGVPDTALEHLFEPFYRVDEARARKTGGSGIGLAICQRVVLLHAGRVRARANRPTGLIVTIELPIHRPEP